MRGGWVLCSPAHPPRRPSTEQGPLSHHASTSPSTVSWRFSPFSYRLLFTPLLRFVFRTLLCRPLVPEDVSATTRPASELRLHLSPGSCFPPPPRPRPADLARPCAPSHPSCSKGPPCLPPPRPGFLRPPSTSLETNLGNRARHPTIPDPFVSRRLPSLRPADSAGGWVLTPVLPGAPKDPRLARPGRARPAFAGAGRGGAHPESYVPGLHPRRSAVALPRKSLHPRSRLVRGLGRGSVSFRTLSQSSWRCGSN